VCYSVVRCTVGRRCKTETCYSVVRVAHLQAGPNMLLVVVAAQVFPVRGGEHQLGTGARTELLRDGPQQLLPVRRQGAEAPLVHLVRRPLERYTQRANRRHGRDDIGDLWARRCSGRQDRKVRT